MLKKLIVSLFCALFVATFASMCFMTLYFLLPSRSASASISLPSTVKDAETASENASTQEENTENADIYVADVYESLTLRTEPNANSHQGDISLAQMTHLKMLEKVEGTNYAYVEVASGEYKGNTGYVNTDYIARLGDHTVRVNSEE